MNDTDTVIFAHMNGYWKVYDNIQLNTQYSNTCVKCNDVHALRSCQTVELWICKRKYVLNFKMYLERSSHERNPLENFES